MLLTPALAAAVQGVEEGHDFAEPQHFRRLFKDRTGSVLSLKKAGESGNEYELKILGRILPDYNKQTNKHKES